jgi:hypothetical protein
MAAAEAFVAKHELSPKPLSFWVEQEAFLQNQLKEKPAPTNVNVPGLESKKSDDGRITFHGSAFQRLGPNTRLMREDVKKLTGDVPSYTQLLADQQDYFYPYFVMIPGDLDSKLFMKLREIRTKEEEEQERIAGKPLRQFVYSLGYYDAKALLRGDYNHLEIVTDEKENLLLGHIRKNLLPHILSLENNSRPLCVYFFHIDEQNSLHALGGIFWKKDGVVQLGLYDPIYFERNGRVLAEYTGNIYIAWNLLFREVGVPYHIMNLSELCINVGSKGPHCVQYVMDASYCSIYLFYFFFLFAKHGYPTDIEDIKKVIYETYVVESPELLRRDAFAHTNAFRLTLIHFAMNTILLYTKDPERHTETYKVYNDVLEKTGYRLLTDDMYEIAKASSVYGGGQRRKTSRRNKQRVQKSRRLRRY